MPPALVPRVRIVLGCNVFGWRVTDAEAMRILDAYVDAGGTMLDTADQYTAAAPGLSGGESEDTIGRWCARSGRRDQVVIGTKVGLMPQRWGLRAANIERAAEDSLRRLRTDHLDVYYAHADEVQVPIAEISAAFDALVQAGKVRYAGISNVSVTRAEQWLAWSGEHEEAVPMALQPHYNLLHREPFEREWAHVAERHGLAVYPYFALASGLLTGKYTVPEDLEADGFRVQVARRYLARDLFHVLNGLRAWAKEHDVEMATLALAWLLHHPRVTAPITSVSSPMQLEAALAATRLSLTEDELAELHGLTLSA
ncbi:aldo/keto reductase [Amycolatopsis sp. RM579]|uniref:Aldo/keto reductase n=1 Tax=Amycolatopsis pithecellobii TaxID=664692 RepID=A0A6N7ZBV3_9PSEU|nr:aldo/keto reductase [Amycolatopsis pithecellobii]